MAIKGTAREFAYQGTQFVILAPISALLAQTQILSPLISPLKALLNASSWDEFTPPMEGSSKSFTLNPLSEANRETVFIAASIGLLTTTCFQALRKIPGFKNSPKTSFLFSSALSAGVVWFAAKNNLIPTHANAVSIISKNILIGGGAITIAAKAAKIGLVPALNFADLLSSVVASTEEAPQAPITPTNAPPSKTPTSATTGDPKPPSPKTPTSTPATPAPPHNPTPSTSASKAPPTKVEEEEEDAVDF